MRRLFLSATLVFAVLAATAIPARRGQWQTLTLADGSTVRAQLTGDEHLHFWQAADGQRYVMNEDGSARIADMEPMRARAMSRRDGSTATRRLRAPKRVSTGERTHYLGQKKGIVILMEFTDTKFKAANDKEKYNDLLNKENYSTGSFKGSVADYFKAQSNGQFHLSFDVLGPYTASKNASYYGSNDSYGYDLHADELIVEAVTAADSEVDFSDYDWDGDGEADQVFVVYAGKGEADGGTAATIWPHMYYLAKTGLSQQLDGIKIDTYACANELSAGSAIAGIGCFCHEFSHCLGYPDFYDIMYHGWFGMSEFDIMDLGNYNGNAFCPAGYTAYEKWMAGWKEPTILAGEDVSVDSLVATSENGSAYIMYNDGHADEYYMIENRQKTNWDAGIPASGLMITHVDFDKEIWEQNSPNSRVTTADVQASESEFTKTNNHQRCTIFHADNDDDSKYWNSYAGYYSRTTLTTDLYPCNGNDSLTATSNPAATLYNANSQGKKTMQGALLHIRQNSDKTMSFFYRAKHAETGTDPDEPGTDPDEPLPARGDTLFYESFDKCASTGGNDGVWGTNIAGSTSKFATDNRGWDYQAAYAGYQCARFGNMTKSGEVTTPRFTIDGDATLTFRAAGWSTDPMDLTLTTDSSTADVTATPTTFTMTSFAWTDYTVTLSGKGTVRIAFKPVKRFLLDEVLVLASSKEEPKVYADVNGDGSVDVADIAAVITVMAGSEESGFSASADVNGDGVVDVADIGTVISVMASK